MDPEIKLELDRLPAAMQNERPVDNIRKLVNYFLDNKGGVGKICVNTEVLEDVCVDIGYIKCRIKELLDK